MISKGRLLLAVGVLGSLLGGAGVALANPGGGHGGGGGGGGHAGGSGGGHGSSGGGHGGGAGAGGHFGGAGGAHYAAGGRFAGGASHGYAGANHAAPYGGRSAYGYGGAGGGYAYGGSGGYRRGYSTGATWGGGYWRGGYWPRAYYGLGYSWFLPVLPLAYATYWYGASPYYYANDVYYTWNPDYQGYTATDPPPVDSSALPSDADGSAQAPNVNDASANAAPAEGSVGGGRIFMYPKKGQSDVQQSTDKRECQQWASNQAGQGASNNSDYRRAMMACLEGRGYSAN